MDFGSIHAGRAAAKEAELKAPVGRLLDAVEDIADGRLPHHIKVAALAQAASLLEGADTALATPGGIADVAAGRSVLALGAGPTGSAPAALTTTADTDLANRVRALASSLGVASADQLVTNMVAMFAPLVGLTPAERDARMSAVAMVLDGSTPVERDGTLAAQHELDGLNRRFGPIMRALHGLNAGQTSVRMEGMLRVADGRTPVLRDGTPDITSAVGAPSGGISAADQLKLDAAKKARFGRSATGKPVVTNEADLSDADQRALGIPPRR